MNNSIRKFELNDKIMEALEYLYLNDIDKFNFMEALITALAKKEPITIDMSLNKPVYTVKVKAGKYLYKDEFKTIEEANNFIDMIKALKG